MRTTTLHIALLLIVFPIALFGQTNPFAVGSAQTIAESATAQTNSFAVFNNPAALDSAAVGISAKQFYLVEGLQQFSIAGSKQFSFAKLGVGLSYFGDEFYNESLATVAVSKSIAEDIHIGASIQYLTTQAQFAEQATVFLPQLGLQYKVNPSFTVGTSIRNPLSQDYPAPFEQNLSAHFSVGGQYSIAQQITTLFQADILENNGFSAALGVDYQALKRFSFQFGGRLHPGYISAGISFKLPDFDSTIGSQYQQSLGFSPNIALEKQFR